MSEVVTPATINAGQCLLFSLDNHQYGIPLSVVKRVVHAVEVTPLPNAPPAIVGVITIVGVIVPVVSARRSFQISDREMRLSDKLIVASVSRSGTAAERLIALMVDTVEGVRDFGGSGMIASETLFPGLGHLKGLVKTDLGIVLIYDLAMFLSLEDERALAPVLSEGAR